MGKSAGLGSVVAVLAAWLLLAAGPATAQVPQRQDGAPVAIKVDAQPIPAFSHTDAQRKRFGALEYRGGLVLTSSFTEFGGLSAVQMAPDGEGFIAATDKAWWFRGRITYSDSRPTGIADAEMAPMLGPDGRPLAARRWFDTESIAQDGGTLYVGIERVNRIVKFDYGKSGLAARGVPIEVPPAIRTLPTNKGLEALVFVPKGLPLAGNLIAISERGLDRAGNTLAFVIGSTPSTFAVKRSNDFDVSDAALSPDGDLLVLERKFSWTSGLFIRMRRLPLGDINPGALVDGPVLFDADLGYQIDNLEALGVHRAANGDTVLTLISDNNFSPLQRTLLLQFTLKLETELTGR